MGINVKVVAADFGLQYIKKIFCTFKNRLYISRYQHRLSFTYFYRYTVLSLVIVEPHTVHSESGGNQRIKYEEIHVTETGTEHGNDQCNDIFHNALLSGQNGRHHDYIIPQFDSLLILLFDTYRQGKCIFLQKIKPHFGEKRGKP